MDGNEPVPPCNQRSRLAGGVYPGKHSYADCHEDTETRHELEKLYTERGLDIRWLCYEVLGFCRRGPVPTNWALAAAEVCNAGE